MSKTVIPPLEDPVSPYEFPDSRKLHDAAERALDYYLTPAAQIMATPYTPNDMFMVNPQTDTESLLATPANPSRQPRSCSVTLPACWKGRTARPCWALRKW